MTKSKRFFIFFSSAGVMSFFLFFTLSVREDKPLDKYTDWMPGNRVISMMLSRKGVDGERLAKQIDLLKAVPDSLEANGITRLELLHALKSGDVNLFHQLTSPKSTPKSYYIDIVVDIGKYGVVALISSGYTEIVYFGIPVENTSYEVYIVLGVIIGVLTILFVMFRRLFKRFTD
jgi:hypothetical protein|tara:strand:+ start:914 stop:1438 length:525 start_codon:yes stop_codon:yes gene_type:complete